MGAELIEWKPNLTPWREIDPSEWEQLQSGGLEVEVEDLDFSENGLFEFKGKKVLVYIRDQPFGSVFQIAGEYTSKYRYHLTDCGTLQSMRANNRYESRYVVTTRIDGLFVVNPIDQTSSIVKSVDARLYLCGNCLNALRQMNYNGARRRREDFSIQAYFEHFDSKISRLPPSSEFTKPVSQYSRKHEQISKDYREGRGWICDDCNCRFAAYRHLLHLHHINGDKSDYSTHNLRALCVVCHSKQPNHKHLKNDSSYLRCLEIQLYQLKKRSAS